MIVKRIGRNFHGGSRTFGGMVESEVERLEGEKETGRSPSYQRCVSLRLLRGQQSQPCLK